MMDNLSAISSKTRVLIVDDKAEMRHVFENMLYFEDDLLVVGAAENGQEAIEKTQELVPDVILMDVEMPVLDGIQATQQIRKNYPGIVIINVSSEMRHKSLAIMAGAADYLLKPFSTDEVIEAIHRALETHSQKVS
ncbi:MAG TPA: response regulator [Chloroflexia bacterium]|nr:response regulator [Chloroflexia bacterium]